jgi:ATP:ADP antiporter, AAA family
VRRDLINMVAMMALFFLVVCAVGILRPIRNALALDGLGSTDFYKVYLVSAVVVLFVPLYNRISNRVPWRWLIPAVALFFAANLLLFRAVYTEGSTVFGLAFYGWYDLFAAALVTQFFMATQMFFDARLARRAYPLVIAGGSIGATLGGAITGFFAQTVGTPNLMLVAAGLIGLFSIGIPLVLREGALDESRRPRQQREKVERGELRTVFANRQVRLIAGMVLMTILVKQIVDYEFNTLTKAVFVDRDAISAFQGKFNAATQWLPIVVLVAMQPALKRWGIGLAVLLLPVAMLFTTTGLVLFFGLWAAVASKGAETALRYSAERAGREILYVPIPADIKLKAKTYIDVAVEKGVGKVLSAGVIFVLLLFMDYRWIAAVAAVLAAIWVFMGLAARGEYVRALSAAMHGRFASMDGVFASVVDASTGPVLERALRGEPAQIAFALDLIEQAPPRRLDLLAPAVRDLLGHPSATIRTRALDLLTLHPADAERDALQERLSDPSPAVREAAVRAFCARARADNGSSDVVQDLLDSDRPEIRVAVLACITRGQLGEAAVATAKARYAAIEVDALAELGPDERVELALAAGATGGAAAVARLASLSSDEDSRVACAALRSAGNVGEESLFPALLDGLRRPATREAARDALARQGARAVPLLARVLLDAGADPVVRRAIPSVLARIPEPETVSTLVRCALARETEQILDFRVLKALGKLRARNPDLVFDPALIQPLLTRETAAADRYADAIVELAGRNGDAGTRLLEVALREAWAERREGAFRTLGLLFSPQDVYRCYLAVVRSERVPRANALEWLETTLGRRMFLGIAPVLAVEPQPSGARRGTNVLATLPADEDGWIARCAGRAASPTAQRSSPMDPVEKVLLLQQVDLLRDSRSAHLALVASISDEVEAADGEVLMREGELADALYIVIEGTIALRGTGTEMDAGPGRAFGTWSLIDEVPSMVEARASGKAKLLRIGREEFYDLLSDYPELAIGLMQGLARRMRALVA